ncbi:MAG: STAS domain-containing protein [Bacteroidales bacterium]|nr:STAS domain-containing protein [Bacteroidales bacterium]
MIRIEERNGITIARFTNQDRINALISEPVKEQLLALFREPNLKLALDLNGIKFIDSTGFSIFLSVMKAAGNNFGEFKICNVSSEVKELFQVLQLHNVFELYDSLDECLAGFDD